jgi:hypothetical protein
MNPLNSLDVTKYIAACCKKTGVMVEWEASIQPRTDGKTMWLPYVDAFASEEQVVELKQFVKHETSHIAYSDFGLLDREKPVGLLMFLTNLIEDHRVDYINDFDYIGDRHNTEEYMRIFERKQAAIMDTYTDEQMDILAPLFSWDLDHRDDLWIRTGDPFTSIMSDAGKEVYGKLSDGDYGDVLRNIRLNPDPVSGTDGCYQLAKRIIKEVFEQDPESMSSPSSASGKGEGGEGEGEDKGEAASGDGEDKEGKDGKEAKADKLKTIDMHGAKMMPYTPHAGEGEGVNASNYTTGDERKSYTPTPYPDISEHNFVTGSSRNLHYAVKEPYGPALKNINKARQHTTSLANQVRTHLQIVSRDRWEYGKKKGKLHNSALYRVGLSDAKGFNERIFKSQIRNETLDVCVQVLVDASGSMSGEKFYNASAAACILNDVLGAALHIPLDIVAFTEHGSTHAVYIMKEWDRVESSDKMASNFSSLDSVLADNVDGESLAYGFNRIKQRKEKRKLMIVLSDGSPCGGHTKGSTKKHTFAVIEAVQNSPVELIGVGLMYDGVKHFYKKWAKIEDARSIEASLLSLISNNIIRSV